MNRRGEVGAADSLREARVVLDPGARSRLAAWRRPLEDERRQPFGGRIDGGRQARRARSHDQHVVFLPRRAGREPEALCQFGPPAGGLQVGPCADGVHAGVEVPVLLRGLEFGAIGEDDEREPLALERRSSSEQRHERVRVRIDPAVCETVERQELPELGRARGRAPSDDRGRRCTRQTSCARRSSSSSLPCFLVTVRATPERSRRPTGYV